MATLIWERAQSDAAKDDSAHDVFEVAFDVLGKSGGRGRIAYGYTDGRTQLGVDDEPLMKVLHDALAVQIERLLALRGAAAGGVGLNW